jgi:hypothetical protein
MWIDFPIAVIARYELKSLKISFEIPLQAVIQLEKYTDKSKMLKGLFRRLKSN